MRWTGSYPGPKYLQQIVVKTSLPLVCDERTSEYVRGLIQRDVPFIVIPSTSHVYEMLRHKDGYRCVGRLDAPGH